MRFNRIQLVGLAALAGISATAKDASANNVTITTATTTPLSTSSPDGVSPGDVTVASGGSITVTTGQTAVTVNTNNSVSNAGTISSNDANNTTGVLVTGVRSGTITNSGTLSLLESYVLADSDNDGDLDGTFATGSSRNAIWLGAGSALTGDVIDSGIITVEGNNSHGVLLDGVLNGNLNVTGSINVTGDNSAAVAINGGVSGGVTGNVFARGNVTALGTSSSGLVVNAPITGQLRINGAWTVTGYHSTGVPSDPSHLDADDLRQGGAAIAIHDSVGGGVTIEGVGVEDDLDDDGDGLQDGSAAETNDDLTATISVYGSSPALLIQALPGSSLLLGANPAGFGLQVRGALNATALFDGFSATAVRIEGDAGGATTTITNGAAIDNAVTVGAVDADAFGVYIGNNAIVPQLLTRRSMIVNVGSDLAVNANGIYLASGASLPTLTNSGLLRAQLFGEIGSATAITDLSNTLSTINNSGTIQALITATDEDTSDGIPPPPVTGAATAINLSASTIGVTLNQIPDAVFTDDDSVDDDASKRPEVLIQGDILFGSGADTLNLLAGAIEGDVSFGAGADSFVINNGAVFSGRVTDTGALTIDVIDGELNLGGGAVNITSAHFGADATLGVSLSPALSENTLILASGTVTFDAGSRITPVLPSGLPASGAHTFLTAAGGLVGASNVTGVLATGPGVPFLYNVSVGIVSGDPNSLEASYLLKTPLQLGLSGNQTTAFTNIIAAVQTDADASDALVSLNTQADFLNAYEDLMPSYASGATELAATAIQQAQSASTNRLAATRLHGLDEVSVWAQEIGYAVNRDPPTANGQEFRGQGFGFAGGIDGPLDNGALFGLSVAFVTSEVEEPARPQGEISNWFAQGNAYLGTAMGPIDLDFVAGAGVGKLRSRRFIEIGPDFDALAESDWWAYEGHAAVRASAPMSLTGWLFVTPQVALTYVGINEQSYTESGAGALDYEADSAFSQRLWADVGVEVSGRWNLRGGGMVSPRIYAGYRANAVDDQAERTFRFPAGGSDFTLTDEPLGDGGPLVGAGFDATNGYSTFSLTYEGEFGDQIERNSLNAAIRFKF